MRVDKVNVTAGLLFVNEAVRCLDSGQWTSIELNTLSLSLFHREVLRLWVEEPH